ncbi:MAG: dephospho-CoA kinase, partial [Polyangiaceae bacterium]
EQHRADAREQLTTRDHTCEIPGAHASFYPKAMVRVRRVRYWKFSVHLFGLTGGIASGKSAVAARFRACGLPVLDADVLAREVVAKGSEGLAAVVLAFGEDVIAPDGELDRKAVADLVFSDADARRKLNAIIHPRIAALTMLRAGELGAHGEPLACYEAALLVENKMSDAFRPLVVVSVPLEVQVARAMARDNAPESAVRKRLAAQTPLDEKIRAADIVIDNTGSLEELAIKADFALADVCRRVGVDAQRYAFSARP